MIFYWGSGNIGFILVFMPALPFVCGLVSGPIFMLYSTKIKISGMALLSLP
ncbi:MAG: hypothetical protein WAO56_12065 [Miniphocaeibacter sp.]|uniref:hypothetical protein n=1 Tax=Miniphocaeibacter sp. TaxID=3100973 RepID=UPI003BAE6937